MVKPNKEDQDANRNTSSDPPPQQTEEYLSALEAARILCGEIEVDNMKSDACPCGETSTNESSSGSQGHASMPITDQKPTPLGPPTISLLERPEHKPTVPADSPFRAISLV